MGQTFESIAPATGEVLGSVPRSGAGDVDRAVAMAKGVIDLGDLPDKIVRFIPTRIVLSPDMPAELFIE